MTGEGWLRPLHHHWLTIAVRKPLEHLLEWKEVLVVVLEHGRVEDIARAQPKGLELGWGLCLRCTTCTSTSTALFHCSCGALHACGEADIDIRESNVDLWVCESEDVWSGRMQRTEEFGL